MSTSPARPAAARTWVRLIAASVALVGLAFIQDPGLLAADTKLDLALDPSVFLQRALHLWDPDSSFGQLQNQAYGYLWPMGPFFWLGDLLGVPGWAVQRTWLALVLVVSFLGSALLARALGIRSDLACVVAGLAYALSPRAISVVGSISIEQWPSALAPWVLLPLVRGSERGSARRAALLSALAVSMIGGVNAAATLAALPLGVVWLLTRSAGPRRRTMMWWWPAFTVMGTIWWLVPLFVLGAYSPPFLDFIESASNTTFSTDLFDALRGTSNWVPYVDPGMRAGNDLIRSTSLIINGGAVVLFGLLGLLVPRNPHRLFLGCSLLLGLVLVTLGHEGATQGWFAGGIQQALDGALAPLRNVHKFDPVVRLPMVLGLAWFVESLVASLRDARARSGTDARSDWASRLNDSVLVGTAVVAVLAATLPALTGRLAPVGATPDVPEYWGEAAAWLDDRPGTALLLPGSSFGEYVWGFPHDEPFQSLARSSWAVRNAVPLAPAGNIRMLDAIEQRLAQGRGSDGLAAYLRRSGVRYLVVRNDLVRSSATPDPVLVHQALDTSPGIVRVVGFGGDVGGEAHLEDDDGDRILINGGWQDEYQAVEIFEVRGDWSPAETADELPVVVGGPEDLLDLADLGVIPDGPTVLASDVDDAGDPGPGAPVVLTDGMRLAERHFGRINDGTSATLTPDEPLRMDKPVRDYTIAGSRWATSAEVDGADVSASSSMSDANAYGTVEGGQLPFAAVDGDPATAWRANYDTTRAAWWRVRLTSTRSVDQVVVTAGPDEQERVRVHVGEWVSDPVVVDAGRSRVVLVGSTADTVRVEDVSGRPGHQLALAEVAVDGVEVTRRLVVPDLPEGWRAPDVVVLRAVADARTGCADVDRAVRCVAGRDVASEEPAGFRRRVTLPDAASYVPTVGARARPGNELVQLLLADQPIGISASTVGAPDPRGSALAAIDGDPGTTWTASLADFRPELRLSWLDQRVVSRLEMEVADDTAARLPAQVILDFGDGREVTAAVGRDGTVDFQPVRTDTLAVRVQEAEAVTSLDFQSRALPVPVGISELRVEGMPYAPVALPTAPVRRPCGSGPSLDVGGTVTPTRLTASPAEIYAGGAFLAEPCGSRVELAAGENEIEVGATAAITPTSLVLDSDGIEGVDVAAARPVGRRRDGPVSERYEPDDGDVLALRTNVNDGWDARRDGRTLTPVTVDGWRQAWRLDSTSDTAGDPGSGAVVTARFGPDRLYRWGLAAGLVCFVWLLALALWPRRRWPAADAPALRAASPPGALGVVVAVVAGGLLAGWPGALAAATVVGAVVGVAAVRPNLVAATGDGIAPLWSLLGAGALVPVVTAFALRPWADADGWAGGLAWPPYLVVMASALPLVALLVGDQGGAASLRRRPGSSTTR